MVHTGYDATLVALSIAIAVFASYTALDLGGRVRGAAPGPRWAWVAAAALAMGGGIWSMHFVGMLAFEMAMPVTYALGTTLLSFLIAVGATGAGFAWVGRRGARTRDVLLSGPLVGVGVAAMHYTGMAAMRIPGTLTYSLSVVAVSVLIAVTAATAALWLTFRQNSVWQKLLAACVMGLAVAGMHYTGMAAASFTMAADLASGARGVAGLGQQNLALYVAGATFLVLFLAMVASSVEQQRVQRALHASEERFRAAAEAVGDIIWTNDAQGRMVGPQPYWERFTGQSQAEYQGHGWAEAIHPDDVRPTVEAWNEAVSGRRVFTFEHRVRRRDGEYRLFSIRAMPVLNQDGTVREWVGVHEDITERKQAEAAVEAARDAAEEANRAKSQFIANMSHELRTPLSAIIGYSEMLQEEVEDGAEAADLAPDMRKIEANARHLLSLINDVLDLSKVESGKMEVYAETFEVEPTLREVESAVQSLMEKKHNILELRLAPDLGTMRSDVTKIRQVLLNLLSNAAKFTESGTIMLSAERGPGPAPAGEGQEWLTFRVADTGIGMTEEQQAKLFQRFQQADASTTRKFGGTGLGLALTKAFSIMLGGDVEVQSSSGQGSIFTVQLPADYEEKAGAEQGPAPQDGAAAATEADAVANCVLVVDDDPAARELLTRFLEREGFAVRTAPDGRTGLEMARSLRPRAILLDVLLPGLDGWSVLSALKADPNLASIPVVMETIVSERGLAASLGAADYLTKPIEWDQLKRVMDRFLPAEPSGGVLVVEDDPDARARLRAMLKKQGWRRVAEAGNGREALDMVARGKPSLVLLDLMMPEMDGFTFYKALRTSPGCQAVPVVVLTAKDVTEEDRAQLRGTDRVLAKDDTSLRELAEELRALVPAAPLPAGRTGAGTG